MEGKLNAMQVIDMAANAGINLGGFAPYLQHIEKPPQTLSNVFGRNTVLKHAQRLVNGQRKLKTVWDELRQASELSLQLKNLVRYTEPVTLTQGYLGLYCCETEKRLGNQLASSLRFLEPEIRSKVINKANS